MFSKSDVKFFHEKKGWKKDFRKKLINEFYKNAFSAPPLPEKNNLIFSESEDSDTMDEMEEANISSLLKLGYSKKELSSLNPLLIGFLEKLVNDTFNDINRSIIKKYSPHFLKNKKEQKNYMKDKILFEKELMKTAQNYMDFFFAILHLEQDLRESQAHSNLVKYGFLIVKRSHQAVKNNDISYDDLPKLTSFLQKTRQLLDYQNIKRLESFKESLIDVYAINSSYAEIIGEVGLGIFGISLVITALMTGLFLFCFASSMTAAAATTYGIIMACTGAVGSVSTFSAAYFGPAIIQGSINEAGSDFKHIAKYIANN